MHVMLMLHLLVTVRSGRHWGLVMCVIDVGTACRTCITDASGVARLVVRFNGSE